jgi:cytochrome b561
MPALIILLLGLMMSSHHQDSMTSTTVHKQWGYLLGGFAVARLVTYVIMYTSPPSSVYPSRPPTELISAFCLISGGLVFMASTKDIIHYMEGADLMAMFVFTVVMGFTAFIMSYEVFVLCLKGWATRKELDAAQSSVRY